MQTKLATFQKCEAWKNLEQTHEKRKQMYKAVI